MVLVCGRVCIEGNLKSSKRSYQHCINIAEKVRETFISKAAFLVKVSNKIFAASIPCVRRYKARAQIVLVFPEPAPARITWLHFVLAVTMLDCSGLSPRSEIFLILCSLTSFNATDAGVIVIAFLHGLGVK